MARSLARPILTATLIAGTLDILAAVTMTLLYGRDPMAMLRYVGSGPFPGATQMGTGGSVLGLAVHFALMAIMATIFILAAARFRALWRQPLLWGFLYGVATYVVMNLLVVPWRFDRPLPSRLETIGPQLAFHIFLVGIPIALVAAKRFRRRGSAFA
jgi:uncharacterized membrane protein YagU involved in acid resistance